MHAVASLSRMSESFETASDLKLGSFSERAISPSAFPFAGIACHPVRQREHVAAVRLDDLPEGVPVAGLRPEDGRSIGPFHPNP